MYQPSHKVQATAVLWAQGFHAGYIGQVLGVSGKSVYQRLNRMKKRNLPAWSRMTEIRRCHFKAKSMAKEPRLYGSNLGDNDMVAWTGDRGTEFLQIVQVF